MTAVATDTEIMNLETALAERARSEAPSWWRERQAEARRVFEQQRWPAERDEPWRYSQVEKVKFDAYDYAKPAPSGAATKPLIDASEAAGRIVFDNGHLVSVELDANLRAKGVYLATISETLAARPELLERHFMTDLVTPAYGKFASFHGALVDEGAVLVVPKGVEVAKPIEVQHVLAGRNVTLFPHLLIVAEDNSRLSFVSSYSTPTKEDSGLVVGALELIAGPGSKVNFITVNDWGPQVTHFEIQRHLARRDSEVKNLVVTLGSAFTRMNVEAKLGEPGASSEMFGLWVGGGRQRFDHRTLQEHAAPNCHSDVLYKGALLERSRSIYAGLIRVDEIAQKTDAYQTNRNMVMSDKARADTIPMLEIKANDVKCSHGATVGQVEFEHLFYLMSRGVPRAIAEQLIVFGFFEEVLNRLPVPAVTDELRDRIGENLIGADYAELSAARDLVRGGK